MTNLRNLMFAGNINNFVVPEDRKIDFYKIVSVRVFENR